MPVEHRQLRNCLGHFATGVSVVTCAGAGGQPHGATVNAFASVSLDPPLVLVSLAHTTKAGRLLAGNPFTVNVLRAEQEELALHFAGRAAPARVHWAPGDPPRLADPLAYLACSPWRAYDGGDHTLYLGRVEEFGHVEGEPLVFYRGRFAGIGHESQATPWIGSLDSPEAGWLSPVH
jgi:flavin reductase (DIM6/NTAB) family NADH-FMN oxidoreductase RutF